MPTGEGRFEIPVGAIDGVNTNFTVSVAYRPGSLRVWRNGVLYKDIDDDGWIETSSTAFQMKVAPKIDDRITVYRVEQ